MTCYNADVIMAKLTFLLNNSYVSFLGFFVFLQICGIPMGTNAAPNITNILLLESAMNTASESCSRSSKTRNASALKVCQCWPHSYIFIHDVNH